MHGWQALILGLVEGLTEYLPISSTGHLILVQWLVGLGGNKVVDDFNIVIQAGAIVAVIGLYWSRLVQMCRGVLGKDTEGRRLAVNLVVAFLPAAALGPLLHDRIEAYLFAPWPVIGALFVGAWLMLVVARNQRLLKRARADRAEPGTTPGADSPNADAQPPGEGHRADPSGQGRPLRRFGEGGIEDVNWRMALLIGFAQCIAMWPGTSRSMVTIVAALLLGMGATAAAEFSFLLGLITLGAATGYAGLKGGSAMMTQLGVLPLVIGFVAAAVSAALAIKWFVGFLNRRGLAPFGWYRLVLSGVLAALILTGVLSHFG